MLSHSCPSQVHGLSVRPREEYAHREVIYYSLQYVLGLHDSGESLKSITSKSQTGTHAAVSMMKHSVKKNMFGQKEDAALISWHSVGFAVGRCVSVNVYV